MSDHIEVKASDINIDPPFDPEIEMEKVLKDAVKTTLEESKFIPTEDGEMSVVSVSDAPEDTDEVSPEKVYETINSIPDLISDDNLNESAIDDFLNSVDTTPEEEEIVNFFPPYETLTEEDIEDVKNRIKFDEFDDLRFSEAYIKLGQVKDEMRSILGNAKSIMDYTHAKDALKELLDEARQYQEEMEKSMPEDMANDMANDINVAGVSSKNAAIMAGRMRVAQIEKQLESMENEHTKFEDEFQEFLENFNKNLLKLKYAIDILQQKVESFKDAPDKITFILNEMVYLNQKRVERLEEAKKNGASEKSIRLEQAHIDTISNAISDVSDMSYILSKYDHNDPKFIKELKRFKKNKHEDSSYIYDKINVINANGHGRTRFALPMEDLKKLEETLNERFGNETDFICFTMEWLLSKMKSGLSTGYSTYYSLFFRSICDIHNGTYDLGIPEEYLKHLDTMHEEFKTAESLL